MWYCSVVLARLGALRRAKPNARKAKTGTCSLRLSAFGAKPKLDTNPKPFLQKYVLKKLKRKIIF